MDIDFENLKNTIITGDSQDWADIIGDFSLLIEEVAYMFKNSDMFTNNERYELIEQFRQVCKCFADDSRATGTLMKHIDIDG